MSHSREKNYRDCPQERCNDESTRQRPPNHNFKGAQRTKRGYMKKTRTNIYKKKSANKEIGNHKNSRGKKFND